MYVRRDLELVEETRLMLQHNTKTKNNREVKTDIESTAETWKIYWSQLYKYSLKDSRRTQATCNQRRRTNHFTSLSREGVQSTKK